MCVHTRTHTHTHTHAYTHMHTHTHTGPACEGVRSLLTSKGAKHAMDLAEGEGGEGREGGEGGGEL